MSQIVARKVITIHKNGFRIDYTHVTDLKVLIPIDKQFDPLFVITGETEDVIGGRINTFDKLKIKDLHMTVIDWYIPNE